MSGESVNDEKFLNIQDQNIQSHKLDHEQKSSFSKNYREQVAKAANLLALLSSLYVDKICIPIHRITEDEESAYPHNIKAKADSIALNGHNEKLEKESKLQKLCHDFGFITEIIAILDDHKHLLIYANGRTRKDLAQHLKNSYEIFFKAKNILFDMNDANTELRFKQHQENLLNFLDSKENHKNHLAVPEEREILAELLTKIIRKFNILLSGKAAQENLDKLQAMAIAFNSNLPFDEQMKLASDLLLVKELWQPILHINISNNVNQTYHIPGVADNFVETLKFKTSLNKAPRETLEHFNYESAKDLFNNLLELLIKQYHALEFLTNNEIIAIYDRLKNHDPDQSWIIEFLLELHKESQLRYNANRLSDSGYELMKRFQSYDTIVHQIDLSEFTLAESFLLRRPKLLHEIMLVIGKHTDNIKAFGMVNSNEVTNALQKIKIHLEHNIHKNIHGNADFTLLLSVQSKLMEKLEPHISKRYTEFDKFTILALKIRYIKLFHHINNFLKSINNEMQNASFVQELIIHKLAQDYCSMHHHNSLQKLRAANEEKSIMAQRLNQIDFVKIFDEENLNRITNLNFRKQFATHEQKTSLNYINSIIYSLVSDCTASQLEKLYKSLQQKELSEIQLIIKQEIINQITKRTTISKLIYSIFSGSKKEFERLKSLKKHIHSPNESVTPL